MAELLYKLREWLTIPEAAAHLTNALGESVTEADVLRLGLDDHLTLSINYVNPVWGWLGRASADETFEISEMSEGSKGQVEIEGIWDLPMSDNTRLDVESRWQTLIGGTAVNWKGASGAYLNRPDGTWSLLWGETKPFSDETRQTESDARYAGLGDADLVVRTTELDRLKARPDQSATAEAIRSARKPTKTARQGAGAPRPDAPAQITESTSTSRVGTPPDAVGSDAQASNPDSPWKKVTIRFTSDHMVQFANGDQKFPAKSYGDLGLVDARTKNPKLAWLMFQELARRKGIINKAAPPFARTWPLVEKRMQELRKCLREFFKIDADPIPYIKGEGYTTAFKIDHLDPPEEDELL